jgi:vitamin B12 transporter
VLSAAAGGAAQAQSATAALAPVVITASRSEQALPDALLSTKVISRAQIEQSQAVDLPALIRAYTAIDVAQSGPAGSQTSLFLRGADSKQVLLVVDGVAMNRADNGLAAWQHLALAQIDRVEIVRGNASALWGSQAVGGVVQVFTRHAERAEFILGLGSSQSVQAALAAGQRLGEGAQQTLLSYALSHQQSKGYNATDPATGTNSDRDGLRQTAASARIQQGWASGHSSTLSLSSTRTRSAYDGSYFTPGPRSEDDALITTIDALGLTSRHTLATHWQLEAQLGQTRQRYQDPTGAAQDVTSGGSNRTRQAQLQLSWQAALGHALVAALEHKGEQAEDSGSTFDPGAKHSSRATRSVRLGWLGSYVNAGRPIDVQASVRNDDSSAFGSASTGLLALAWSPLPGWKGSTQLSTAFSAPSFADQQFAVSGVQLRPEHARNLELALQYQQDGSNARLAWFRQRQSDRIASDGLFHADFRSLVNIAQASNRGFELLGQTRLGTATLGGEAIWQNPKDLSTGQVLKRRARQSTTLNLQQPLGACDLGVSLRHTAARADLDPITFSNATAPAGNTLGLSTGWAISPAWRLAAKLDNATNQRNPEVLGYNPAPRSLGISLSGKL